MSAGATLERLICQLESHQLHSTRLVFAALDVTLRDYPDIARVLTRATPGSQYTWQVVAMLDVRGDEREDAGAETAVAAVLDWLDLDSCGFLRCEYDVMEGITLIEEGEHGANPIHSIELATLRGCDDYDRARAALDVA